MSLEANPVDFPSQPASRYRAIARLGQGGMADVFLAQMAGPSGFSKLAVIKRIRNDQVDDDAQMKRLFLDEARLAARLNHPNVISTFEVGEDLEGDFIAMEFLDGQPLNAITAFLRKQGTPLELGLHLHVINDVLTALDYAHELADYDRTPLRIVHRDVSPQNIFVLYTGQTKLVDFGVAKASSATQETRSGVLKGKVKYMAPEQAKCLDVDRRADIFAVGILLWEALAGRRLWSGMNDTELLMKLVTATSFPSPRTINPDVSAVLEGICVRAMAVDPDARYATAAQLQADLEVAIEQLGLRRVQRDVVKLLETSFGKERAALHDVIERFIREPLRPSAPMMVPLLAQQLSDPLSGQSGDRIALGSRSDAMNQRTARPISMTPVRRRSRVIPLVLGAIAVVGTIVGWKIVSDGPSANNPRATGAPGAPLAPASSPEPTSSGAPVVERRTLPSLSGAAPAATTDDISIDLRAAPPNAKVFLDDIEVSNPYTVRRARDAVSHTLRVVASGFQPSVTSVSFARDIFVDISLQALPAVSGGRRQLATGKPTASPNEAPPPTPPSPRPAAAEKPSAAGTVTLDPGNPWK